MTGSQVKQLRLYLKLSQKDFGERFGASRDMVANIENERVEVKEILERHMISVFGLNASWAHTGEGDMFEDTGDDFLSELSAKYRLDPFQQSLVRAVYEMPPEQRKAVLAIARKLVAENPETEHEKITRIANDYLDAYEDTQPQSQTDTKA